MRTGQNLQTGAEAVQGQQSHLPGQAVQLARLLRLLLRPDLGQEEHGHNGSKNVMSEQSINLTNDDNEPGGYGAGMEEGASPTARSGMISLADLDGPHDQGDHYHKYILAYHHFRHYL